MSNPLPPSSPSGEPSTRVSYAPPDRPASVTAGCLMSWSGAAFGIVFGVALIVAAGEHGSDAAVSSDEAASRRLVGILFILWCFLVVWFATKSYQRKRWGAIGLAAMGTAFALFTLFNLVATGSVASLPVLAWVVAAVVLVLHKSREWYAAR